MTDTFYMMRCLELAKKGIGRTMPNPSVGAVIVYKNLIIGEGYTSSYGNNHAEVNAILSVKNKELLSKSTMYVTLEPCSHYGKTPPCSNLIIEKKIPNIVIGCVDENDLVKGKGIEKLIQNGCNVRVGVLENECKEHHKRFFTYHQKKRPYIILKWAQTKDGFIAPKTKQTKTPFWITNIKSRQLVHQWRSEEHAILVGAKTVLEDNPRLTVRDVKGQNPIRIVIDTQKKLSKRFDVFNNEAETLIYTTTDEVVKSLYSKNIQSLLVEGGAKTLQYFINKNLWDEARVFVGNCFLNDGVRAPIFNGDLKSEIPINDDVLKIYRND